MYCRGKEDVLQGELGGGGGGLERAGRPSSMRRVILKQRVADTDTSCVKVTVRQYTQEAEYYSYTYFISLYCVLSYNSRVWSPYNLQSGAIVHAIMCV